MLGTSAWGRAFDSRTNYRGRGCDFEKLQDIGGDSVETERDIRGVVDGTSIMFPLVKNDLLAYNFRLYFLDGEPSQDVWYHVDAKDMKFHSDSLQSCDRTENGKGYLIPIFSESQHGLYIPSGLSIRLTHCSGNNVHLVYTGVQPHASLGNQFKCAHYQDVSVIPTLLFEFDLSQPYEFNRAMNEDVCFSALSFRGDPLAPESRIFMTARLGEDLRIDRADKDRIYADRFPHCSDLDKSWAPIKDLHSQPPEFINLFDESGLSLANKTLTEKPSLFANSPDKTVGFWSLCQFHNANNDTKRNMVTPAVRGLKELRLTYTPDPSRPVTGTVQVYANTAILIHYKYAENKMEMMGPCFYVPYWHEKNTDKYQDRREQVKAQMSGFNRPDASRIFGDRDAAQYNLPIDPQRMAAATQKILDEREAAKSVYATYIPLFQQSTFWFP